MDKGSLESPEVQDAEHVIGGSENQSPSSSSSQHKVEPENKIVRRPGRPPLRFKGRPKNSSKNHYHDNQNDEDFSQEKPKLKEKSHSLKDEKENNIEGFLKIIDYLKKIDCDETSLHNKMNPYNLLTPTCYWYMISAEYFSFDFFSNKTPHEIALQILRKAQKTPIILPLRVLKPLKMKVELEFETQQLCELSAPITQKLTSLIPVASNSVPQTLQKSSIVTSIADDNEFRSSVRAIAFNWIKKKISSNDRWGSGIKQKLEAVSRVSPKQFMSSILECKAEVKHQQLDVALQIYNKQRKQQINSNQPKVHKQTKKPVPKPKKNKKPAEDQIYDESESEEEKKVEEMVNENENENQNENENGNRMQEQKMEEEHVKPEELQNQNNLKQQGQAPKEEQDLNSDEERDEQDGPNLETTTIKKIYTEDDLLLDSIMHLPLDSIISILKCSIQPPRLPLITPTYLPIPKNDPLELVYQIHPEEEVFLDYMKDRQERLYFEKETHSETLIEEKQRQGQVEDAKCQVCTDGDYTDDNLIVFCSMCNISLHQRCVGLAKVPADNWICEVCASFGPAGINVPCPLCHVKGGALKRTSIHINTPLFKDTNPQYHEFAKKCPNYKHKEQYINPKKTNSQGQEQPYYDYFSKSTYPTDQPVCHFVWVHYVCTIWIPQCYFEEKNGLINIKGIQNIDKKRFKERCLVCKETKAGACVKCDNEHCNKHYHPQCARKKKIYMEQLNLDKLKYLIFCEAHQPLKVKRKIEVKRKKQRDQIVKFCRGIEKYVQTYKIANLPFKLLKIGANPSVEQNKLDKKDKMPSSDQKISIKIQKNTDEDFIRSVIDGLIKQNQIVVNLSLIGDHRYKVDEIIKPSKRDMRKSLTRQDEFWKNFKSIETPETNLKRFNTIMRQNNYLREKIDNFINFGSDPDVKFGSQDKKFKKNSGRRRKQKIQTVIEQEGGIFCVCRKPYQGQVDMFECEVCNQWYHHECIGFVGSEEDAQNLVFHCMKCLKFQPSEIKRQLLEKCSKFFSEDSLFLNYRPPTPSLQSQQSQQEKHHYISESNKKQNYEMKDFAVEVQNFTSEKLRKHIQKHYDYSMIEDDKINLEKPFIIFDPTSNQEIFPPSKNIQQEHNQPQPENEQEENIENNQVEPSNKAHEINEVNEIQQNKQDNQNKMDEEKPQVPQAPSQQVKNEDKIQIEQKESIMNKSEEQNCSINEQMFDRFPSNSSQLMTPYFPAQSFSFGGDDTERNIALQNGFEHPKPSSLSFQKQNHILLFPQKQNQIEAEDQNEDISNRTLTKNFHFNRLEVQKLKTTIEENEKFEKQEDGSMQKQQRRQEVDITNKQQ